MMIIAWGMNLWNGMGVSEIAIPNCNLGKRRDVRHRAQELNLKLGFPGESEHSLLFGTPRASERTDGVHVWKAPPTADD